VLAALVRVALERCRAFPALHAAAVDTEDGAVLFAGEAGCGKSTLVAALWAAGHDVRCDDTVVLDGADLRARPVTPYLCLKSGSWPHLDRFLPELACAPGFRRWDGRRARYLRLPEGDASPAVRAIVFPTYRRGGRAACCRRLDPATALARLLACIDPIGRRFSATDVERLVRWVARTPSFALEYGSTEDALRAVDEDIAP
jgi:energy-coupling factor transporter ATP-binding protein EcfA2